ncbi:hypothetical protein CWB73_02870 [Pseudoalteromonas phenolica]|uniref:Periplasmic binding protein domain-containing protein n=1 Tax=Pseudoalteromonas phenolica TaxID=161398 RepID=A0A5S3YYT8_9GAMM|nr:ABC transporter substrate-binding protein [Pseudoalteromonas phenolica]TMP83160.1 hypothetical protein CWB73_02870 [Pseudoalteromonas phenolica]
MIKVFLVLLVFSFLPTSFVKAQQLNVMFLNPGHPSDNPTGHFWPNVNYFMQEAADDLNINLKTIYANRNHILMKSFAKDVIENKPDFAVIVNEKGVATSLVNKITAQKIKVFMLLNDLTNEELNALTPEQREYYAGSLIPNNFDAGFTLAEQLHQSINFSNSDSQSKVNILALHGDETSPASIARAEGLQSFITDNRNINLIDSTVANWSKQQAYEKVSGILKHQKIDIIWAANDAMACGATSAVINAGKADSMLIGGINWDDDIPLGRLSVSVGGHVTLGAYAMVLLKEQWLRVSKAKRVKHSIFQHSNVEAYETFMTALKQKRFHRCDFTQFLSNHTKAQTFSIENLICH